MINKWVTENYDKIISMSKKVCKGSSESEEVAHYCLSQFLEHSEANALIERNEAMKFLSGMMHRSFHSSTSQYHTLYRQKGRVHPKNGMDPEALDEEYDIETDLTIEAIEGILEDMQADNIELWYRSTLFRMYIRESNYSEIERQTGIPRTSISQAVKECKKYIKKTLNERGIN
jgi:DNA-directed RNA polymerase specialized sigma24 family protein